jgi:large subunit ribosomal protein L24
MHALKQRVTKKTRKEYKVERANKQIRKGDIVQVIAGRAFNKTGKVLKIYTETNRCLVEKVNMMKKHRKPTQQTPGGIDEKEASIHLSNVKFISRGATEDKKTSEKKKTTAKTEKPAAKKKVAKG